MNDNKDNGFETTMPTSKKTFKPHDFVFGGQK
jgi:hypothetical protein